MTIEKHSLLHKPFQRVLIANRGEIALRVIRACRDLRLQACAVYSTADINSQHVGLADAALCIGAGPSAESYLKIETLIDAAKKLGADAVHPGYGFLSENAEFAQACFDAGLVWIGPSPESIRAMGNKTIAKKLVTAAGVPCSPGKDDPLGSLDELKGLAKEIGYPLILKAAAGGGGRGMKVVREDSELAAAFEACQREALSYFANPDVFCERFVENPRHVELQIIADSKGNTVHLFDRDCTVQRRHQKLFEEAPSSYISDEVRQEMGRVAVKAAEQVGYVGAGTVEFLLESPTQFYFMEMNTRVQVEHPVTEEITGVDLVATQLKVAMGGSLPFRQEDIRIRGWACEARINAEDPYEGFRPCPGSISNVRFPSGGGVRVDSHIYPGYAIPEFYDSMIAKLITVGSNREDALRKMDRALGEFEIEGPQTTLPFHQSLVNNSVFLSGNYTTRFLEEHGEELLNSPQKNAATETSSASQDTAAESLAAAAALVETAPQKSSNRTTQPSQTTRGEPAEGAWGRAHRLESSGVR